MELQICFLLLRWEHCSGWKALLSLILTSWGDTMQSKARAQPSPSVPSAAESCSGSWSLCCFPPLGLTKCSTAPWKRWQQTLCPCGTLKRYQPAGLGHFRLNEWNTWCGTHYTAPHLLLNQIQLGPLANLNPVTVQDKEKTDVHLLLGLGQILCTAAFVCQSLPHPAAEPLGSVQPLN